MPRALAIRCVSLALVALALVSLVVPFVDRKPDAERVPASVFSDYFAAHGQSYCWGDCPASAQRVCISGDCPCFDEPYRTQCYAERRADFQSRNPPRGEITGVCWAGLYKWERDPATGQQVLRVRSPIFSRVKFNETEVLSTWARDPRDAGFEVDVGGAWGKFVDEQYAASDPARDGWNWSKSCVSLNSPRNTEDKGWTDAQKQATYQRVFLPGYGIADTPEERALEAKAEAERQAREKARLAEEARKKQIADAKAAEEARQRAAAEAARKAELARVEAARQQRVAAIADQIGPGKRAEAERLQKMNDELAALRPKPQPSPTPRQCTQRQGVQNVSSTGSTREAAEKSVLRSRGTPGGSESIVSSSVGGATCKQQNIPDLIPRGAPVGECLACVSEKMATNLYGWVKGQGWPPPKTEWVCSAQVTFTAERCGSGSSRVTAQ